MLSKIPWKKIFIGIVLLFAISHFFGSVKPEDAVSKAIENEKFTAVADVYKDADKNEKTKIAYAIIDAYYKETEAALNKKDNGKLNKIKASLSSGENMTSELDSKSNEQLGMLVRLFDFLDRYQSESELKVNLADKFKDKYGESISGYSYDKILDDTVYVNQQLDDGTYVAYGVKSLPTYSSYGYDVYQSGYQAVPDYNYCVGVLKRSKGKTYKNSGAYRVRLLKSTKKVTLTDKSNGFKEDYPVYLELDGEACELVGKYSMLNKQDRTGEFKQQQKAFEMMKKAYLDKNLANITLEGFDLYSFDNDFVKFGKEKKFDFNTYFTQYKGTHYQSQTFVAYNPEVDMLGLQTSNGIKLGMTQQDVKGKMGTEYVQENNGENVLCYLLPNGQFIEYLFENDSLKEIRFARIVNGV